MRLTVSTLRAVKNGRFSLTQRNAGIERVKGTLAGRDRIDTGRIGTEGRAAILPQDACVFQQNAAAPVIIGALQHAGGPAFRIGRCQIYGIAMTEWLRPRQGDISIDLFRLCGQKVFRQPGCAILNDVIGIGDAATLQKCLFYRLSAKMVKIREFGLTSCIAKLERMPMIESVVTPWLGGGGARSSTSR